jgi:hypothetical protein
VVQGFGADHLASLDDGFMRKMVIVKIRTAKVTFFIFLLLA